MTRFQLLEPDTVTILSCNDPTLFAACIFLCSQSNTPDVKVHERILLKWLFSFKASFLSFNFMMKMLRLQEKKMAYILVISSFLSLERAKLYNQAFD